MPDEYFSRRAVSHVIMQSRDSKRHIFIVVWTGKKMISLLFTIFFFHQAKRALEIRLKSGKFHGHRVIL